MTRYVCVCLYHPSEPCMIVFLLNNFFCFVFCCCCHSTGIPVWNWENRLRESSSILQKQHSFSSPSSYSCNFEFCHLCVDNTVTSRTGLRLVIQQQWGSCSFTKTGSFQASITAWLILLNVNKDDSASKMGGMMRTILLINSLIKLCKVRIIDALAEGVSVFSFVW